MYMFLLKYDYINYVMSHISLTLDTVLKRLTGIGYFILDRSRSHTSNVTISVQDSKEQASHLKSKVRS